MTERGLRFSYFGCQMVLNMPTAMVDMPITNLRKIFKLADQDWRDENRESVRRFFSYIPEVEDDLKEKWGQASLKFQRDYLDTKFDSSGHLISSKNERTKRKRHNDYLKLKVQEAKSRYDRFKKRVPKLEELRDQYLHE